MREMFQLRYLWNALLIYNAMAAMQTVDHVKSEAVPGLLGTALSADKTAHIDSAQTAIHGSSLLPPTSSATKHGVAELLPSERALFTHPSSISEPIPIPALHNLSSSIPTTTTTTPTSLPSLPTPSSISMMATSNKPSNARQPTDAEEEAESHAHASLGSPSDSSMQDDAELREPLANITHRETLRRPHFPVLLIPGFGGSVLKSRNIKTGEEEEVWVRYYQADQVFRDHLWCRFNETSNQTESIREGWEVFAPAEADGLHAIDTLAPHWWLKQDATFYYHNLIAYLEQLGYVKGQTMFGFPYDWRQSAVSEPLLESLLNRLRDIHRKTGQKIDVISHSMGCSVVHSFVRTYPDLADELIHKWMGVTCPFTGGAGAVINSLIGGNDFGNYRIDKLSALILAAESPSVYELLPDPGAFEGIHPPRLTFHINGSWKSMLYGSEEFVSTLKLILTNVSGFYTNNNNQLSHTVNFNQRLWKRSQRIRQFLRGPIRRSDGSMLGFTVTTVSGTGILTPYDITYEKPVTAMADLVGSVPVFGFVDGDGTLKSSKNIPKTLQPYVTDSITVNAAHVDMLSDQRFFPIVRRFVGLSCSWSGQWSTTIGILYLEQHGSTVITSPTKISAVVLSGQVTGYNQTHMKGTVAASAVTGQTVLHLDLSMADNCLFMQGSWEHDFPTSQRSFEFIGRRESVQECKPDQLQPCKVPNGFGHRYCVSGVWSSECLLISCFRGYSISTYIDGLNSKINQLQSNLNLTSSSTTNQSASFYMKDLYSNLTRLRHDLTLSFPLLRFHSVITSSSPDDLATISTNAISCWPCPIGFFKSQIGVKECVVCPPPIMGTEFSRNVSSFSSLYTPCTVICSTGFQPFHSACIRCRIGTFKSAAGNHSCQRCPPIPLHAVFTDKSGTNGNASFCDYRCENGYLLSSQGTCQHQQQQQPATTVSVTVVEVYMIIVSILVVGFLLWTLIYGVQLFQRPAKISPNRPSSRLDVESVPNESLVIKVERNKVN